MPRPHVPWAGDLEYVEARIIQDAFNQGQFWERAQKGELQQVVWRESHPKNPPEDHPYCTRSQNIVYFNAEGVPICRIHQYLKPDGTIGGSGRPDPKVLVMGDRILATRVPRTSSEATEPPVA
jgi:hypothetical protein